MRDEYDFSDAVKNPFAGKKEKGKYTVTVHYDFTADDSSETKKNTGTDQQKRQA